MSEIPDFLKKEHEASERRKDVIRNASAYRFFNEHKTAIMIICAIAVIGVIVIGSTIRKHNYINSLYKQAIEYQEKENYSTALHCLDKILGEDANNKKAKELYPIVEEASHRQEVKESLNSAVEYKNNGNYISAYNCAQSAYSGAEKYGYSEEKATAEQLMNELRPLKEHQEAEQKAKAEQEAKAKQEAEAKAKAEQEAKAKQEAEAKAKAEQEAKAKQEAEAKAKAEQEAKAKQEAEAKAKAEQEAKASKESYINNCIDAEAISLLRSPSAYTNKHICVTGYIVSQVTLEKSKIDSTLESLGIYETENLEEVIIEDSTGQVAVLYNPGNIGGIRLLEGDYVSIYGEFLGLTDLTSTNVYGTQNNYKLPQLRAKFCN